MYDSSFFSYVDALSKTLEDVKEGIKKFEVDKENQTKELEELKMNQSGFYTAIRQLNSTLADKSNELSSLKMNYSHFSLAVNETIDDIWRNQSLQDIEMMDIFSNIRAGNFFKHFLRKPINFRLFLKLMIYLLINKWIPDESFSSIL